MKEAKATGPHVSSLSDQARAKHAKGRSPKAPARLVFLRPVRRADEALGWDGSPEGELTTGILDEIARYERLKIAERSRRGKLRKAREGKMIATKRPHFGFRYSASRDGYEVEEETMDVVGRIFRMIGTEGVAIRGVKKIFEWEGLPTPEGKSIPGQFFPGSG